MKIAVFSGKGGAGKTLVATNLAALAQEGTYIDCDVEEPNGHIFLQPQEVQQLEVTTKLPTFDQTKCSGCRKCVDFCRFNALFYIKHKPLVFPEICHSCGGCQLVCPCDAIREIERPVGRLEIGYRQQLKVVTGILNIGEASAVPVISSALSQATPGRLTIIDGPPGSSCSVMESMAQADYCLLVVEPTAFGLHNFQMVHQLAQLLHKSCGVVLNKIDQPYAPLEEYCHSKGLPILARLPYDQQLAEALAAGKLAHEQGGSWRKLFSQLLNKIGGVCP